MIPVLEAFQLELEKIARKRGLWDNIHAKRRRIAAGSGERMRRPGSPGAPTAKAIRDSQKTAAAYRPSEYEDGYMLNTILERLANISKDLQGRIKSGAPIPSWAEYKVYKGYDGILSALGSTYSGLHEKKAEVEYRGRKFPGYNKPIASDRKGKKKMVLVKRGDKVKLVHFGQKGYEDFTQHKDKKRRENYLKRSGGIRGKGGKLTKNDPFSPNYWARRELW